MGRFSNDEGSTNFKELPPGTHIARCYRMVDIGTQHDEWEGEEKIRNQLIVMWEVPAELVEIDGKKMPLNASKFYTNMLGNKANLRKDLEAWRSKPFTDEELKRFDLMNILGKPCMLTVVHNAKGKAKVVGVSALPKGITCPDPINAPTAFWIDPWSQEAFDELSDGLKKLIGDSDEYKKIVAEKAKVVQPSSQGGQPKHVDDLDDDIPF
jgi:hypothetical protein